MLSEAKDIQRGSSMVEHAPSAHRQQVQFELYYKYTKRNAHKDMVVVLLLAGQEREYFDYSQCCSRFRYIAG